MKKQTIDLLVPIPPRLRRRFGFALIELLFGLAIITIPVGIPFSSLAQSGFTKITTGPIPSNAANSGGTTWVDFDNDGDLGHGQQRVELRQPLLPCAVALNMKSE